MSSKFAIINIGCRKKELDLEEEDYTLIGTSHYLYAETKDLVKRLPRNTPIICVDNTTWFRTLGEYLDSIGTEEDVTKKEYYKEFITSKEFLVNAHKEDSYFFAFELQDKTVISVEIQPMDYPDKTICHYENVKDFVDNTEWHDWIVDGIESKEVKELIK